MRQIEKQQKLFTLDEAQQLLPLIKSITAKHQLELAPIQLRLNKMLSNDPRRVAIEDDYELIVGLWKTKVEKLGAYVQGLWVVEFDMGDGSLCWRNPELHLSYFRPSGKSFSERVHLQRYIEENDPDWAHY